MIAEYLLKFLRGHIQLRLYHKDLIRIFKDSLGSS